jgi:hypothetical protein
MDWYSILDTTFTAMFWVGFALTVLSGVMSGAFHHEVHAGSSFDAGVAHDLGGPDIEASHGLTPGHPVVGWTHGELGSFSPLSPTVICATLTGAGGLGWLALRQWNFGPGGAAVTAVVGGLALGVLTFLGFAWVFRHFQATSHVAAADMIGRRASVDTTIEPGAAGAIAFEGGGGRMVVPARSTDAATIPRGADVEIVGVNAGVYQVKETRESWLARSKGAAR